MLTLARSTDTEQGALAFGLARDDRIAAAWLLEGEGALLLVRRKMHGYLTFQPRVSVKMTSLGALRCFSRWTGRPITSHKMPNPKHQPQWEVTLYGQATAPFLRQVRPFFPEGGKGEQADILIAACELLRATGGHRRNGSHGRIPLPTDVLTTLENYAERLRVLYVCRRPC
jgi:hypothetical protein